MNTIRAATIAFFDGYNADDVAAIIGHDRALVGRTCLQVILGGQTLLVKRLPGTRFAPVPPRRWLVRETGSDVIHVLEPHEFVIHVEDAPDTMTFAYRHQQRMSHGIR